MHCAAVDIDNALQFFWVYTLRVELLNNMMIFKRFATKISVLGGRLQDCAVHFLLEDCQGIAV